MINHVKLDFMKKIFFASILAFFSNISFAQTTQDLEVREMDRKFIVSSTNFVCSSMITEKITFNAYLKQDILYCDVDNYLDFSKADYIKHWQESNRLYFTSKEIIYNRIITNMSKGGVLESISEFDCNISNITFKFSYITNDYYKLNYEFSISTKDLLVMMSYLNKDDFYSILKDIK